MAIDQIIKSHPKFNEALPRALVIGFDETGRVTNEAGEVVRVEFWSYEGATIHDGGPHDGWTLNDAALGRVEDFSDAEWLE